MSDTVLENKPEEPESFLDDQFAPLDMRSTFKDEMEQLAREHPEFAPRPEGELGPDELQVPVEQEQTVSEVVEEVPEIEAEPETETTELGDGSALTIEKTKKGWKAVLSAGEEFNPEVFYGATKNELLQRIAVGKIHATRKIREQNRQLKLGADIVPRQEPSATIPHVRELTADEKFEIKTSLQADPDLAMSEWFQKKTGMTVNELVRVARESREESAAAVIGEVAREFMQVTPSYYSHWENFKAMVGSLAQTHLKKVLSDEREVGTAAFRDEINAVNFELYDKGFWNTSNLTRVYEDLNEAGLLHPAPVKTEVTKETVGETVKETPKQVTPTPPNSERTVRTVTRPRAGFGLKSSETTSVVSTTEEDKPLTVEEMNNMSVGELEKHIAALRQERIRQSRR